MNNYVLVLAAICFLFAGCTKDQPKSISYSQYDNKSQLIRKHLFELRKNELTGIDSITVFHNKEVQSRFKQKEVPNQGLFRICSDSLVLTHSFLDTTSSFKYCSTKAPFLNMEVQLIGFRNYLVSGKSYRIFHYSENNGAHSSYDTYYLQGLGFICIYNFDRDEYILGDSTNMESIPLKEIGKTLVRDTSFFAKFTLPKLFPNYYRTKGAD